MRRSWLAIPALALAAGGAAWWLLRGPQAVTVVGTTRGPAVDAIYATGTVEPTVMLPVGPRVAGRIVELRTDEGRSVRKGEVLARLDTADLDATLENVPKEEATILLAHEPDYADYVARHPVDLQLSGHSHGGQVRLPFLPPLYLPSLARKYVSGLYQVGALTLYTNPGLGTVGVPIRWNCPPEITLLTLRPCLRS